MSGQLQGRGSKETVIFQEKRPSLDAVIATVAAFPCVSHIFADDLGRFKA